MPSSDLSSDSNCIYLTLIQIFKQKVLWSEIQLNRFVCHGHKAGKLAIVENRGILKIRSRRMNFWIVEKMKFIAAENRHSLFV